MRCGGQTPPGEKAEQLCSSERSERITGHMFGLVYCNSLQYFKGTAGV